MKTILVAEIGINHNGDMNIIKKLIDYAKMTDCKYVKFQKRDIDLVYTKEELNKYRESPWGKINREQKQGLELLKEKYDEIDNYCKKNNIGWFASIWDVNSIDFIMQYDIPFIKIPSALNTNLEVLNKIKQTKKDVIISTGMTNKKELDYVIEILGNQIKYILSCTSTYPTKNDDMNMNRINTLKKEYPEYKIGFSNHSSGILYIIQAVVMGCEMVEYHCTLDRSFYGSDQSASIEPSGMIRIKDYIDGIEEGWGTGKIECLKNEEIIKDKLRK